MARGLYAGIMALVSSICERITIALQPTDQTVSAGSDATFSVTAGGTEPITYQWQEQLQEVDYTFFEAGTTEYPFAGSVGSPVTTDSNWASPTSGTMAYHGEYAEPQGTTVGITKSVYYGNVKSAYMDVTVQNYASALGTVQFGGIGNSTITRFVTVQLYPDTTIRITHDSGTSSAVETVREEGLRIKSGRVTYDVTGASVDVTLDFILSDDSTYNLVHNIPTGINTSEDYGLYITGQDYDVRFDEVRIDGYGFPYVDSWEALSGETSTSLTRTNIGTTGDPFGTQYRVTITNNAGSDTSDTVTVTETP